MSGVLEMGNPFNISLRSLRPFEPGFPEFRTFGFTVGLVCLLFVPEAYVSGSEINTVSPYRLKKVSLVHSDSKTECILIVCLILCYLPL